MGKRLYSVRKKNEISIFRFPEFLVEDQLPDGDQLLVHTVETADLFSCTAVICLFWHYDRKMQILSDLFILDADVCNRKYLYEAFFEKYPYDKMDGCL